MTLWLILSGGVSAHGDIHERIGAITKQIEATPLDAPLYAQRAELERQHEDWQAALSDYAKARKVDPTIDVDLPLGRTLLESGRPEEALPLLNRFLDRTPTAPRALIYRARTYVKLDRNEEALTDYRAALKCTPVPEPDLIIETADSLTAHGLEKEALLVLSAGIEKLGDIPSFILRAMDLEIATKNYDAALGRVRTVQQTAPRPEPWMARRASILAQAGRIQESKMAWQALVEHLAALPNLERGSQAMSKLMEDAKLALASLDSLPKTHGNSGK